MFITKICGPLLINRKKKEIKPEIKMLRIVSSASLKEEQLNNRMRFPRQASRFCLLLLLLLYSSTIIQSSLKMFFIKDVSY